MVYDTDTSSESSQVHHNLTFHTASFIYLAGCEEHGLFPVTRSSFSQLHENDKTQVICDLIDLCAPDQRLIVETVRAHLSRDFLILLPPELFLHLLAFLPVEDLITSVQVSRGWRQRIREADPIWKAATRMLGLDEFVISTKFSKYGSIVSLVVAAVKHRRSVSSSTPQLVRQTGDFSPSRRYNWQWAGSGIIVDGRTLDIARISSPCVLSSFPCIPMNRSQLPVPEWAVADRQQRYLIWRGSHEHDGWVRYDFGRACKHWREPQDLSHHVAGMCDHCSLITTVPSEITDGMSLIKMTIRKLLPKFQQPVKAYCQLKVPTCLVSCKRQGMGMLKITDAETFLHGSTVNYCIEDFCDMHHILLKFEYDTGTDQESDSLCTIAEYSFPTAATCGAKAIEPIRILQIEGKDRLSFFQLSSDGRLASIIGQGTGKHHIWKPGDSRGDFVVPVPPDTSCCLALGHLYSVLQCTSSVEVVATFTGQVLLSCPSPPSQYYHYQRFWVPLDQTWLDDFDFYQEDLWHIVVMCYVDGGKFTVSSIVGNRGHC